MDNPYEPPEAEEPRSLDRWGETMDSRDGTDWSTFFFIFILLNIFFFHEVLFKIFLDMFRSLLYN